MKTNYYSISRIHLGNSLGNEFSMETLPNAYVRYVPENSNK